MNDLRKFHCALLVMRIAPNYEESLYWSNNQIFEQPAVKDIITRDLYYGIKSHLSFSFDPNIKYTFEDSDESDDLFNVESSSSESSSS